MPQPSNFYYHVRNCRISAQAPQRIDWGWLQIWQTHSTMPPPNVSLTRGWTMSLIGAQDCGSRDCDASARILRRWEENMFDLAAGECKYTLARRCQLSSHDPTTSRFRNAEPISFSWHLARRLRPGPQRVPQAPSMRYSVYLQHSAVPGPGKRPRPQASG